MDNIHITDSYKISKKDFKKFLSNYKNEHPDCEVFKRGMFILIMEWSTHNFLYRLGLWKERTNNVDLDYPHKWYVEILYFITGIFSYIFIK